MFGLFKKKEPAIQVIDKVWMTEDGKVECLFTIIGYKYKFAICCLV
ncbi:MAG: hypothetical protein V9E96_14700 [Chitinophagaceae bacterium]